MLPSHISNPLMHSKHLINKPALTDKISCPICCVPFQGIYRPMICCQNRHTICMKCIDGIVQKSLTSTSTEQLCLCPICRQRIQMPLESSEEMKQFLDFMNTLNEMYKNVDNWQNRCLRYERQLKQTKQQLDITKKKLQSAESLNELMKLEINDLKLSLLKAKSRTGGCQKEDSFMSQNDFNDKLEKKLPLSAFIDDMGSEKHLNLVKKQFTVKQIQYLVMYDMTQLLEVNLSQNNIGDEGIHILLKEPYMPNLACLKISNNQITRLPSFKHVLQLQELDLSNSSENRHLTSNKIKQISIQNLMAEKWEKLRIFGIQFENDKVWQEEAFVDDFAQKFPAISTIYLSNCSTKISKARCQRIKMMVNDKANRKNNNKIIIIARSH